MPKLSPFRKVVLGAAGLLLLAAATQDGPYGRDRAPAFADLLLALAVALAFLERALAHWRRSRAIGVGVRLFAVFRGLRRDTVIPLSVFGLVVATILATLFAPAKGKGSPVVEVGQVLEHFLFAYVLFRMLLAPEHEGEPGETGETSGPAKPGGPDARARRWLLAAFLAAGGATILYALVQLLRLPAGAPGYEARLLVTGRFAHANVLSSYLAILLPMLAAAALAARPWGPLPRALAAAGVVLGLVAAIAGGPWLGAVLGSLVAAALLGERSLAKGVLLVGLGVALALVAGSGKDDFGRRQYGRLLRDSLATYRATPGRGEAVAYRLARREAELSLLADRPLLGVGPGRYQEAVEAHWPRGHERLPGHTDTPAWYDLGASEPYSFSMHVVAACETGLLGWGALLWVFLTIFARAAAGLRRLAAAEAISPEESPDSRSGVEERAMLRAMLAGAAGAVVAALVAGTTASPLVRGVWIGLVFVLALADAAFEAARGAEAAARESAEGSAA